jgi:membrane protein CcdC involved in cytochrome C biogenesis
VHIEYKEVYTKHEENPCKNLFNKIKIIKSYIFLNKSKVYVKFLEALFTYCIKHKVSNSFDERSPKLWGVFYLLIANLFAT